MTCSSPASVRPAGADDRPIALTHRIINLLAVIIPFAALVVAVVLLWGRGVELIHIILLGVMYLLTGFGVTIGFHRLFTHRSFETNRVVQGILAALGSMAVEGPLMRWVATHRCHHQHSDGDHDPHSPHTFGAGTMNMLRGFWRAHVGWVLERPRDLERYTADLQRDPFLRVMSALFPLWVVVGLLIPGGLGWAITGSWVGGLLGVLWGGLVRIFVVHHLTWSVNSVCHIWGTRPFRSHDESRNNFVFGVLAFGEGWHNNHHAFPTSARHGLRWWEIDFSYLIIRGMAALGLARNVRVPSPNRIEAKRRRRDGEC